ncbi:MULTISPECIES: branched-chain amino acid ABC transporter permease [unclassified Brenneria]|uniref:branched-chain amino acid ABC transporter permease n=1 Tax=unclassified Brenneria TaxID=2634434 RepID=UPI0029C5C06B|nr:MULTISPECIES: branched-chain amino acid ABC transporter permease [unclassified Brenneria]MDX5630070.1 branched-chain amino acid ABC transporter permease [Brenneria sp. L3-3Z]MDX5697216.1 branched-chain amino acid ABC transporter permease [Brenneria sp. L4-2C]
MFQFILDTLLRTAELSLIAVGLSLVYGLVRFANVAHVQYAMVGSFITFALLQLGCPLLPAILAASALCGIMAALLHHWIFRRLVQAGPANAMIGSLAMSMILIALILGVVGSSPQSYNLPLSPMLSLAGSHISRNQLWSAAVTFLLLLGFSILLFRTSLGRSIRALASNRDLAAASGLNADALVHTVNFIAGALAGLGGSMLAMNASAYFNQGNDLLLPVLAAAILGGLGNPMGAVLGALLIAATETLVTNLDFGWLFGGELIFIPVTYINAASFLILLLALLLRPYGLFNREVRRV